MELYRFLHAFWNNIKLFYAYCKWRYSWNWDGKTLVYDKCDRAITCEFCHNLHLKILRSCLLQKDLSLKSKVKFDRYFSWGINIVTLVTQGLPSSFFCHSSRVCYWTGGAGRMEKLESGIRNRNRNLNWDRGKLVSTETSSRYPSGNKIQDGILCYHCFEKFLAQWLWY